MDEQEKLILFYRQLKEVREAGILMKEVSDVIQLQPSVLSALYTTVLPTYLEQLDKLGHERALEHSLSLVNNVSRKRLLSNIDLMMQNLSDIPLDREQNKNSAQFLNQLLGEVNLSFGRMGNLEGMYYSYSLSSSEKAMKIEPVYITQSSDRSHIKVGRLSVYQAIHEGVGLIQEYQTLYILFSEAKLSQFALVTMYIQLPFHDSPSLLKGIYLTLDYNKNPIARRIVLKKVSDTYSVNDFANLKSRLVMPEQMSDSEKVFFDYTCCRNDAIRMCQITSPKLDERDFYLEKKLLE